MATPKEFRGEGFGGTILKVAGGLFIAFLLLTWLSSQLGLTQEDLNLRNAITWLLTVIVVMVSVLMVKTVLNIISGRNPFYPRSWIRNIRAELITIAIVVILIIGLQAGWFAQWGLTMFAP